MNRTILRASTTVLSTVALAVGLVGPASAAATDEGRAAASWLAGERGDDGLVVTTTTYDGQTYVSDDYGLSLDVALALDSLGRKAGVVASIRDAVVAQAPSYVGADPEQYAGPTAKLLTAVAETGGDPTDAGGLDLVARMEGLTTESGRIQDQSQYGDYANTIGQSLAVRGLSAAGSPEAWPAAQFLLAQQCEAGYFRVYFADPAAPDQTCDAGDPAGSSAPSTDATAFAVLALLSVQGHTQEVDAALADARAWLVDAQRRNGAYSGGGTGEGLNTNSTGLAGTALGRLGACGKALLAARWVEKLQVGSGEDSKLRRDRGAIAYDATAYEQGQRRGIRKATEYQWRLASAQAAPALAYLDKAACQQ